MERPGDFKVDWTGGRFQVTTSPTRAKQGAGQSSSAQCGGGGIGFILAGDLVGRLMAVLVGDGDGEAEATTRSGRWVAGSMTTAAAEAGLQPAEVTLGGGFGKLVEPVGADSAAARSACTGQSCVEAAFQRGR